MKNFKTFWILLAVLIGFGGWGISLLVKNSSIGQSLEIFESFNNTKAPSIDNEHTKISAKDDRRPSSKLGSNVRLKERSVALVTGHKNEEIESSLIASANELLYSGDVDSLMSFINEHYSDLSTDSLNILRQNIRLEAISRDSGGASSTALKLFTALTQIFDDLQAWKDLSRYAITQQNWKLAFNSTLKTSLLENDSLALTETLTSLATIAQRHANELVAQGNTLGTSEIFESLYLSHSGHPRFQFDYANSLLALGRTNEAKTLFSQLLGNSEFSTLSREALAKISANERGNSTQRVAKEQREEQEPERPGIRIPLIPYGTSFLINTRINGRPVTLLLDTGASITSLDVNVIEKLRLPSTGQSITLSTANGQTRSELYKTRSVDLGGIKVNGQTIASIDFGSNPRFSGLLGTDILNNQSPNHAFILDTQNKVLIFQRR